MSDEKVFIFGSFNEDETKSFLKAAQDDSHFFNKSGLQFGSLNLASLGALIDSTSQSPKSSLVKSTGVQTSKEVVKGPKLTNVSAQRNNSSKKDKSTYINGGPPLFQFDGKCITEIGNDASDLGSSQATDKSISDAQLLTSHKVEVCEIRESEGKSKHSPFLAAFIPMLDTPKRIENKGPEVKSIIPRGLMNPGNLCFLNATLQAFLSCSPFIQLLQELRNQNIPRIGYPTLNAFLEFIANFDMPSSSLKNNEMHACELGKSFTPVAFDTVLRNFTPDIPTGISGRPRQEDAQEFLSFLMDQMHDELLKFDGHVPNSDGSKMPLISSIEEEEGWETVGRKNKSAVTRTQSFMPSQLSAIFGGQLRSVVKAKGNKASATVQPYLLLHLDILSEAVHTIEDALHLFSAPETLEGYRASTDKAGVVSASKSVQIQSLSKIMILHLMRFSYGKRGSAKLHKPVHFPLELNLVRELLVSPSTEARKYELVATITHHGQDPSKGHYTTDAKYSDGHWLRFDDASVSTIPTSKVLHDQAYVLFYKQMST